MPKKLKPAWQYPDYAVVYRFCEPYDDIMFDSRKDWVENRREYAYIYAYGGIFTARTCGEYSHSIACESHDAVVVKRYLRNMTGHPDSVFVDGEDI